MDLEAVNLQHARASRLARIGMVICFVLAAGIMLVTLAVAGPYPVAAISTSSAP